MSYEVLARKWRPRRFDELVGQSHVVRALSNALDSDRLHHAFLFTGTRGVGKTTIARILAKSLNCEHGVSSTPCGECRTCLEVDEGRFVDLIEVDAASRTKVDDTRELLDNVQYAPTRGRYKVYLIDEVHMLSGHSFNALLKTLEEPPPHVKFLLATTDPQKLPVTVLSRCLQFSLMRLAPEAIAAQLEKILSAENINHEAAALNLLARAADGSVRDGLSLLDQAIAFGGGAVKTEEVREMLGTIDQGTIWKIVDALHASDAARLMVAVAEAADHGVDFAGLLEALLTAFHHIALAQADVNLVSHLPDEEREQVARLAGILSPEDTQLYYQIGLIGRRDLPLAPERVGLEMALLRMLAFKPAEITNPRPPANPRPGPAVSAPVKKDTAASAKNKAEAEDEPKASVAEVIDARAAINEARAALGVAPKVQSLPEPEANTKTTPEPEKMPEVQSAQHAKTHAANDGAASNSKESPQQGGPILDHDWNKIVAALDLSGVARALVDNTVLESIGDGYIHLVLDERFANMKTREREAELARALGDHLGHAVKLEFALGTPATETPAAMRAREQEERQQAAEESIRNDANVQALIDVFGARIKKDSIRPRDGAKTRNSID